MNIGIILQSGQNPDFISNLLCGLIGSIIGGGISGGITYHVTRFTNNENKKRWEHELFNKKHSEYVINIIEISANLISQMDLLKNLKPNSLYSLEKFYIDEFTNLYNFISKLNIFHTKNEKLFKFNNELLNNIEIYLTILNILKAILADKFSNAHIHCKKLNLFGAINGSHKVNVLDFIDFINSQTNGVWLIDNKSYKFNNEFKDRYEDNFLELIKTIQEQLENLHDSLIQSYIQQ